MLDTVSIIIPIYNVRKYLDKCVSSVIRQTYSNLQIILVDDGSTDGGGNVCDMLADQDTRIEVIHKTNGGLSSARNAGLEVATGAYIYFLDADDYIDSKLVEVCVNTINKYMCDVVAFNYILENEYGDVVRKSKFQSRIYYTNTKRKRVRFLRDVQTEYKNCGWNAWSRFYKAAILKDNKIFFPDNREIFAEDLAYAMRICLYANKMCVISDCLYHYIIRESSIMGTLQKNPLEKFVRLCLDFEEFAVRRGYESYISLSKEMIFSKILYFEIKKNCSDYQEISRSINSVEPFERRKIQEWFTNIKFYQIFGSRNKIRALFMYSEVCLSNRILLRKREDTIAQYWIWIVLVFFSNSKRFLTLLRRRTQKSFYIISNYLKLKKIVKQSTNNYSRAFLLGTEDFGNLGDHQIAVSEVDFLNRYFSNVIEVPASRYFSYQGQKMIINEILPDDIIFLTGGGNFGNVYPMSRDIRNDVVRKWRKNIKIVMPQTAYYTCDKAGEKALKEDVRLLTQKNHTVLIARDQDSYRFLKKYFHCKVLLTPDIVLYSSYNCAVRDRENLVLFCLRSDEESILNEEKRQSIVTFMQTIFPKIEWMDTQKTYNITVEHRGVALGDVFEKIQSASLMITDRLHGMIFCAITGTPCLVLENYNHKVRGSYEWLEELSYIKLVRDIEEIKEVSKTKFWEEKYQYDDLRLRVKYETIMESIGINSLKKKEDRREENG